MFRKLLIVVITASLWIGGNALAGQIYKWTDAEGNVHYEDRPIGDGVEKHTVLSSNTDNTDVQAGIETRLERDAVRSEARSKRDEDKQAAAAAEAESEKRDAKCEESRSRLETYLQSRRLYKQDDAGERVYLDENQTTKARADAQDMIQKYCD